MPVIRTWLRLLFFRAGREEMAAWDHRALAAGLMSTWVVGIGRYWDHPHALWSQYLGLGSVAYVFVLSAFIWFFLWGIKTGAAYRHLLTFITLTSLPGILYAIPVERWMPMHEAAAWNAQFLLLVAAWRMSLLLFYLRRYLRLDGTATVVTAFLPVTCIISLLTAANLENAVFDLMGGFRTSYDKAYLFLIMITYVAAMLSLPLSGFYLYRVWKARWKSPS